MNRVFSINASIDNATDGRVIVQADGMVNDVDFRGTATFTEQAMHVTAVVNGTDVLFTISDPEPLMSIVQRFVES